MEFNGGGHGTKTGGEGDKQSWASSYQLIPTKGIGWAGRAALLTSVLFPWPHIRPPGCAEAGPVNCAVRRPGVEAAPEAVCSAGPETRGAGGTSSSQGVQAACLQGPPDTGAAAS